MSIGEKAPAPPPAHRIVLSDRQRLAVSGVEGVESFDEATIFMALVILRVLLTDVSRFLISLSDGISYYFLY